MKVFKIGQTWMDQFKLSLSMMNGGWMHYHVMDSFCKMLSCHQETISHLLGHIYQQYFQYNTSNFLTTSSLEHKSYKANFVQLAGFCLEKGGLLNIPCYIDKQWLLIVVNFVHKRFDILDSGYRSYERKDIVEPVIYNFRAFFDMGFPNCNAFNIRDFIVSYIKFPKQKFKYDSGVFVLKFMQTFNGSNVQPFSNSDVLALRAKFLFQLLTSRHNEVRSELVQNFLDSSEEV